MGNAILILIVFGAVVYLGWLLSRINDCLWLISRQVVQLFRMIKHHAKYSHSGNYELMNGFEIEEGDSPTEQEKVE